MINVPIDFKFLSGFKFFNVIMPLSKKNDDKLFLSFTGNETLFAYEKLLINLLNDMRVDKALSASVLMQNKIKFLEDLVIELIRYNTWERNG